MNGHSQSNWNWFWYSYPAVGWCYDEVSRCIGPGVLSGEDMKAGQHYWEGMQESAVAKDREPGAEIPRRRQGEIPGQSVGDVGVCSILVGYESFSQYFEDIPRIQYPQELR